MTTTNTPDDILTDRRISAMRAHVLTEVESDLTARRRSRKRRTVGIAAAAAVAVVAVGGGVVIGTQSESSSSPASLLEGAAPTMGYSAPAQDAGAPTGNRTVAPKATPAPSTPGPLQTSRQVITTGTVKLEADDPAAATRDLVETAEKLGGRVDERREAGGDAMSATLRLRVPSERVSELVTKASGLGAVDSISLQHEDVTSTVVDLDARIRATQLSVDRLTDILGRADTSDKVIAAEGALTTRQQELESLQSRRSSIGDRVALSTVTVTITKPDPKDDRSGFIGGLQDGWDAMVSAGRWLSVAVGAVLPWAGLLLVLFAAYRGVHRFRSRG